MEADRLFHLLQFDHNCNTLLIDVLMPTEEKQTNKNQLYSRQKNNYNQLRKKSETLHLMIPSDDIIRPFVACPACLW